MATEKEQSYESYKLKYSKNINKNDFQKKSISYKSNNNNNYQQRAYREQKIPFIKQERSAVTLICAYCKKSNHHI